MTKHTLEPWQTRDETYVALGRQFIAPGVTAEERRFYARRIVACVNALAGRDPDALADDAVVRDGAWANLQEAARQILGVQTDAEMAEVTRAMFDTLFDARFRLASLRGTP